MLKRSLGGLVLWCATLHVLQAQVTVEVQITRPEAGGTLKLALCANAGSFNSDRDCATMKVPAQGKVVTVPWPGVTEGTYAIKVFHDVNDNGRLDTNIIGIPTEPYGFSNNAMGTFGPPSFEQASFKVGASGSSITITMND